MSQHDLTIDNQGFPATRSDLNNALQALGSLQSGTSAPSTTFANMLWYDTTNDILKMRNEADTAWINLLTLDQTNSSIEDLTVDNLTNNLMRSEAYRYENLGVTLSAGVLTLAGYDGTALSATNPAYVSMPSNATPGNIVVYKLTANLTIDESDMTGNTFGTTASTAWANDMPLYLAFCSDDSDTSLSFGLTRIPNLRITPASGSIGDPSAANADYQYSYFSGQDITETSFDGNNIFPAGAIVATKDSSDQWTFGTLVKGRHGLGMYDENTKFTLPTGHFGANSGTYTADNGGTAAVFSSQGVYYRVKRDGLCYLDYSLRNDGGTDGSGAVAARFIYPFNCTDGIDGVGGGTRTFMCKYGGTTTKLLQISFRTDDNQMFFWDDAGSGTLQWADFTNAYRAVWGSGIFQIRVD